MWSKITSNHLTISGTEDQINAALDTLSYQSNPNFSGQDTLTIVSTDSDGTPLTATNTLTISVNPIDDVPSETLSLHNNEHTLAQSTVPCSSDTTRVGSSLADILIGSNSNDTILGLEGNDALTGLAGNDFLFGGDGDDLLNGGIGTNTLLGGDGDDRFILAPGHTNTIFGFELSHDKFLLAGNLTFEQLGITQNNHETLITVANEADTTLLALLPGIDATQIGNAHFISMA